MQVESVEREVKVAADVLLKLAAVIRESADEIGHYGMLYILGHMISSGCMASDDPQETFRLVGAYTRDLLADKANVERMAAIKRRYCN